MSQKSTDIIAGWADQVNENTAVLLDAVQAVCMVKAGLREMNVTRDDIKRVFQDYEITREVGGLATGWTVKIEPKAHAIETSQESGPAKFQAQG